MTVYSLFSTQVHVYYSFRDEKKAQKLHLPFSVADIIESPVERFNEMLTSRRLTEPQLQLMKDIRRRGKNKVKILTASTMYWKHFGV